MTDKPSNAYHPNPIGNKEALNTKINYVYLLATCDTGSGRSYVGWTTDLEKRLAAHNAGTGAK